MRLDPYTKGVLTVIAACLVWMCASQANLLPTALAQGQRRLQPPSPEAPMVVYIGGYYDVANGQEILTPLPLPTFQSAPRK